MTLLKNLQILQKPSDPPRSEECCDLVIQATAKEKCTEMLSFGPLLTEIVEVVQKIKQVS